MNSRRPFGKTAARFIHLAVLCVAVSGCEKTTEESLGGGYQTAAHTWHSWEPPTGRTELWHVDSSGKRTLIWPKTYSTMVQDDVAVFLGEKAYEPPLPGTRFRLFAVRSPELPMEITDQVVGRWAISEGKDPRAALTNAFVV